MARVAFIGLGHMGGGMAPNLAKAGHEVRAFDLSEDALSRAAEHGCQRAASAAEACKDADAVVTMLPAGQHVAIGEVGPVDHLETERSQGCRHVGGVIAWVFQRCGMGVGRVADDESHTLLGAGRSDCTRQAGDCQ